MIKVKYPWDKDTIIEYYDAVGEEVNKHLRLYYTSSSLHTTLVKLLLLVEKLLVKQVLITKKRYAIPHMILRANVRIRMGALVRLRLYPGLKRSDTPDYIAKVFGRTADDGTDWQ